MDTSSFLIKKAWKLYNAEKYYEKALELDPKIKPPRIPRRALCRYQWYQLANENLIKLESLCPKSCDREVTRFHFNQNRKRENDI